MKEWPFKNAVLSKRRRARCGPPPALTGVPGVVAVRPGQLRLEAVDQVEEGPGQDDDVVNAAMQDDHLAGVAETCGQHKG